MQPGMTNFDNIREESYDEKWKCSADVGFCWENVTLDLMTLQKEDIWLHFVKSKFKCNIFAWVRTIQRLSGEAGG